MEPEDFISPEELDAVVNAPISTAPVGRVSDLYPKDYYGMPSRLALAKYCKVDGSEICMFEMENHKFYNKVTKEIFIVIHKDLLNAVFQKAIADLVVKVQAASPSTAHLFPDYHPEFSVHGWFVKALNDLGPTRFFSPLLSEAIADDHHIFRVSY